MVTHISSYMLRYNPSGDDDHPSLSCCARAAVLQKQWIVMSSKGTITRWLGVEARNPVTFLEHAKHVNLFRSPTEGGRQPPADE